MSLAVHVNESTLQCRAGAAFAAREECAMEAKDLVLEALGRVRSTLHRALDGLTLEELHRQPQADANSIAWLAWHLTRVQDVSIAGMAGTEQVWINQKWHAAFDLPPDAKNDGFGDTPEQVAAFRAPSVQTLLDYHESVAERARKRSIPVLAIAGGLGMGYRETRDMGIDAAFPLVSGPMSLDDAIANAADLLAGVAEEIMSTLLIGRGIKS